ASQLEIRARPLDNRAGTAQADKAMPYTKLSFNVRVHATLSSFLKILEKFYRTGLLHEITVLSIQKPISGDPQTKPGDLDISLTVEALCLDGAEKRTTLLPVVDTRLLAADVFCRLRGGPLSLVGPAFAAGLSGPRGPGKLAERPRKYVVIAGRNVFLGNAAG